MTSFDEFSINDLCDTDYNVYGVPTYGNATTSTASHTAAAHAQTAQWQPTPSVTSHEKNREAKVMDALLCFAWIPELDGKLAKLANMAMPENWNLPQEGPHTHKNELLLNYLKATFARLWAQKRVCINNGDNPIAAFHTGLLTTRREWIYAVCVRNTGNGQQQWQLQDFVVAGRQGLGKALVNVFNPLPQKADYFTDPSLLVFDPSKPLYVDYEHIIIDNLRRLPIQMFHELIHDDETLEYVRRIEQNPAADNWAYDSLARCLEQDPVMYMRAQSLVSAAIEKTIRFVQWDYRLAMLAYYAEGDAVSLLLPLNICSELAPDAVLCVERTASGAYQGHTILTRPMAYRSARTIAHLGVDWLAMA